ncbi:MAG: putative DNA binding domain-containing protein [Chitinispirillia bacterium]|nr:putative DNA binding domain-containing protein [Chitinispirillia bacterium]MCL2268843.1 putative DNA binding domain-containing protein [Chitinispirillia bacterium]
MSENMETLLNRIKLGEDSTLEFKNVDFYRDTVSAPRRDAMSDELAAMANTRGGTLIIGVDDKTHAVTGVPLERLDTVEEWVRSIANDIVAPPLDCVIRKMSVGGDDGKSRHIIKIDVPKSLFVHRSGNGYFTRIGSSKREMQPEVLARLFQQRSQTRLVCFDEQIVTGAQLPDMDKGLIGRFRTALSPEDDVEFLTKLKLADYNEDGAIHPTVSGILLCCEKPEKFLHSAFIQAVCYLGDSGNSEQLDMQDITGPLDIQIKDACKFVKRNMRVAAVKDPARTEFPQYSLSAVFEAVVNAVAHRDYSIYGSKIRLRMFSDRLELCSPGTVPNTMTLESMPLRQFSRNELVSSLLARTPMNFDMLDTRRKFMMDKRGDGVPVIYTESIAVSGKKPLYELIDDSELKLTVFAGVPGFGT